MSDTTHGPVPADAVTPEQLERERLVTYLDWAELKVPTWYWLTYGGGITLWIAAYDLGSGWGTAAALLFALVAVAMLRHVTRRSGVSTPRFRGMPAPLKRTFLPLAVVLVLALTAVAWLATSSDDPPFTALGLVIGPVAALAVLWHARACRRAAARIAREHGIQR